MNNDMGNILDLIYISKKSYKIIKQNMFWALAIGRHFWHASLYLSLPVYRI